MLAAYDNQIGFLSFLKFRSNRRIALISRSVGLLGANLQYRIRESDDAEYAGMAAAATAMWTGTAASKVKLRCSEDHGDQAVAYHDIASLSSFHIDIVNNIYVSFCVTCIRFFNDRCLITPSTLLNRSAAFRRHNAHYSANKIVTYNTFRYYPTSSYLHRRLASEGIVSLGVTLSRVCLWARRRR